MLRQERDRALSELTIVELYSALSRRVRTEEITLADAHKVVNQFQEHLNVGFYQPMTPNQQHYERAQQWLTQFNTPLRALDALHLAIASVQNFLLVTADRGLAKSAQLLEIPVRLLSIA